MLRPVLACAAASVMLLASFAADGSAAEPAAAPSERSCFRAADVRNYRYVDPRTVNLRVAVNQVYQVTTLGDCRDINFSEAIAIESRGASDLVCSGLDLTFIAPSSIGPRRCAATNLRRLTAEEVAALPPGARP